MATNRLRPPTTFGLDDLREPNNNNVNFILKSGETFSAAAIMLGFHSLVLKKEYIEAGILEVDVTEFSDESVKTFVEAMYSGILNLTKECLRDIRKLGKTFKVRWSLPSVLKCAQLEVAVQLKVNPTLEDLNEPNNNNVYFILKSGERFGAAALILGFHSQVMKNTYINAGILEVDVTEYSDESVKAFVQAMYCEPLEITRLNFREINKLSHAFSVAWMAIECLMFFQDTFRDATLNFTENMTFLFEEAVYLFQHGYCAGFLTVLTEQVDSRRRNIFAKYYLRSGSDVSIFTAKSLLRLTDDHSVFLEYISNRISEAKPTIDRISKFFLLNMDLLKCFIENGDKISNIFDILLDNEDSPDFHVLNKLYQKVTKEYIEKTLSSRDYSNWFSSNEVRKYHDFPNLSLDKEIREWWSNSVDLGTTYAEALENTAALCRNMNMLLEFLDCSSIDITDHAISVLIRIRTDKVWSFLHPVFVDTLVNIPKESKALLKNCIGLINSDHQLRIEAFYRSSLDLNRSLHYFHARVPGQVPCDNPTECGFIVEVFEEGGDVQIKLLLDSNDMYSDIVHCHEELWCVERMHVVIEVEHVGNVNISWRGTPKTWECDYFNRWETLKVQDEKVPEKLSEMVIYYDCRV